MRSAPHLSDARGRIQSASVVALVRILLGAPRVGAATSFLRRVALEQGLQAAAVGRQQGVLLQRHVQLCRGKHKARSINRRVILYLLPNKSTGRGACVIGRGRHLT